MPKTMLDMKGLACIASIQRDRAKHAARRLPTLAQRTKAFALLPSHVIVSDCGRVTVTVNKSETGSSIFAWSLDNRFVSEDVVRSVLPEA